MGHNQLFESVDSRYGRLTIFSNDSGAVTRSLLLYGEWAENELSFLRFLIDEAATVVDVGAYIGTHALAFSRFIGPVGRVIAFEPQKNAFEILKRNIEGNGADNVRLEHAAVSSQSGEARIPSIDISRMESFGSASLQGVLSPAGTSASRERAVAQADEVSVRVTTIDDLKLDSCALIKIDVEGVEDSVLRGAAETIRRNQPFVYAECNSLADGLKAWEILKSQGQRVWAHVVSAYNPDNFHREGSNVFGGAKEVALVAAAGANIERIERYRPRSCEMLLDLETADDLALALLNKPQYDPEVLRSSAAAKSGGVAYLDQVVANRLEVERLDNETKALRETVAECMVEIARLSYLADNSIMQAGLMRREADQLRQQATQCDAKVAAALQSVYQSTSWRFSAPIRAGAKLLAALRGR